MRSLTIVIPALNEEGAIARTLLRCVQARPEIAAAASLDHVEIFVVSDGSTDRTAELAQDAARRFSDVHVIVFEKNRGYGAAIKEGWQRGKGNLLGFLDADGTCDPAYFARCVARQSTNAPTSSWDRDSGQTRKCPAFVASAIGCMRSCSGFSADAM